MYDTITPVPAPLPRPRAFNYAQATGHSRSELRLGRDIGHPRCTEILIEQRNALPLIPRDERANPWAMRAMRVAKES